MSEQSEPTPKRRAFYHWLGDLYVDLSVKLFWLKWQAPPDERNEPTPQRRAELKRIRLYPWLSAIAAVIGFAGMWCAVKVTDATLPEPIVLAVTLLWCVSLLGWLAFYSLLYLRILLESKHNTEDAIEAEADMLDDYAALFYSVTRSGRGEDQSHEQLSELLKSKRGRGRRPLTQDQMKREIDRAEQKRAELQAQGHTPTEAEIARAIGLSPKTLQRYRDQVDNKGQK